VYEISRTGKFREAQSKLEVTRTGGSEEGRVLLNDYRRTFV
jgi:hypothetical protein